MIIRCLGWMIEKDRVVEASPLIGGLSARLCGVSAPSKHDTPGLLQALAEGSGSAGCAGPDLSVAKLIVIAAVVSGPSGVVEVVEWAADLPDAVWDRLGVVRDALTGARRALDDSTLSRVLAGIDAARWMLRCAAGYSDEKAELAALRRENRRLREDVDILKRAFFAIML